MMAPGPSRHPDNMPPLGTDRCPHCYEHGSPNRTAWSVHVGPERDSDGQPTQLIVQSTKLAHVGPEDADWLWRLIHGAIAAGLGRRVPP